MIAQDLRQTLEGIDLRPRFWGLQWSCPSPWEVLGGIYLDCVRLYPYSYSFACGQRAVRSSSSTLLVTVVTQFYVLLGDWNTSYRPPGWASSTLPVISSGNMFLHVLVCLSTFFKMPRYIASGFLQLVHLVWVLKKKKKKKKKKKSIVIISLVSLISLITLCLRWIRAPELLQIMTEQTGHREAWSIESHKQELVNFLHMSHMPISLRTNFCFCYMSLNVSSQVMGNCQCKARASRFEFDPLQGTSVWRMECFNVALQMTQYHVR